jgi:glycyl-tRNA synthetase beta chain
MVGEFPELQGIMGGYYARAQGESDAVADAIRDHYKPVGQGDDVPTAPVTVAVSLADKLDTLLCFFSIAEGPTGSRDPFALRRAGIAVILLLSKNAIRLFLNGVTAMQSPEIADRPIISKMNQDSEFKRLFDIAWPEFPRTVDDKVLAQRIEKLKDTEPTLFPLWYKYLEEGISETLAMARNVDEGRKKLLLFLIDRLKVQQREAGVRHDLIDAVFSLGGEDDLVRLLARVKALQAYITTAEGANLLAAYKRAANILKQAESSSPSTRDGEGDRSAQPRGGGAPPSVADATATSPSRVDGEELALLTALDAAEPKAAAALSVEDFEGAMAALATLRAPIDAFFEAVMVNDPDQDKRAFRLGLLARFRDAVHQVADFSKIEG